MTQIQKIALIGLPGSGKSSVAPELARRLGWECADLDADVVATAGRPVDAIFEADGGAGFRELELRALVAALSRPAPTVIACGGGLITQEEARRRLHEGACVILLDAPDEVLLRRMGNGSVRPLLEGDPARALPALRAARRQAYATAHLSIPATVPVAVLAERIAATVANTVRVLTPSRTYSVDIRAGALDDIALHLPASATAVALIADNAVPELAARAVRVIGGAGLRVTTVEVGGGEGVKTWSAAGELMSKLSNAGIRRTDCIVAVGGGAVGDLAGFAAATYLRGVAWVNVPTTLLAMVDSAIGGKTGVNLESGKNLAGVFWQPRAVIADPSTLAGLPERAFRSGFSEIVKYAMIRSDGLVEVLETRLHDLLGRDPVALTDAIARCCAAKAAVVSVDEREAGPRAILNYGHTVGHALETVGGFGAGLTHGEAVAVGMRVAGRLSRRLLGCPTADIGWQDDLLSRCGFVDPPPVDRGALLNSLGRDKKAIGERIGWVLLARRGDPRTGQDVPEDELESALDGLLAA